jgi:class 3 adenylate cyclase/predicted NUDIX family NTP pyrophosphohydrolase
MFTDRQGCTTRAAASGDRNRDLVNQWQGELTQGVLGTGGTIVKSLGDGHLITFESVFDAVRAGRHLQRQIADHNKAHPEAEQIHLRIGIDAGDVSVNPPDSDVIGNAVDMAKRVESEGIPGEVIVSERAFRLLRPGYVDCEKFKESVVLKGDTRPTTLYRVTSSAAEDPARRERLSKALGRNFLQVLVPKLVLQQKDGGRLLTVQVERDLQIVTSSDEKDTLFREMREHAEAGEALRMQLAKALAGKGSVYPTKIDCHLWPLRYANGGVLPILETKGGRFFCLFYRDRRPVGWNIANGASDTVEEMLDPRRIIRREFGEELLIACEKEQIFMALNPGEECKTIGYQEAAIAVIDKQFPARGYKNYCLRDFPKDRIVWMDGPDKITAVVEGPGEDPQTWTTEKVFVTVTPEDNAIEVDLVARVQLDTEFQCIDGEMSAGKPIGRIVGLFECEGLKKKLNRHEFFPDRVFFEGCERNPEEFHGILAEYRSRCSKYPAPQDDGILFDICPGPKALLKRFFATAKSG